MPKPPDVVCAFCGHGTVRHDDPDFGKKAADHIMNCEKHPLRAYVLMNAKMLSVLRLALDSIEDAERSEGVVFGGDPNICDKVRAVIAEAVPS